MNLTLEGFKENRKQKITWIKKSILTKPEEAYKKTEITETLPHFIADEINNTTMKKIVLWKNVTELEFDNSSFFTQN